MAWSPQQETALKSVASWMKARDKRVFRLFGYAGTGKTTLAREFAAGLRGSVAFMAFTGKAASVMQSKGCDGASTIHSAIYKPKGEGNNVRFVLNHEADVKRCSLIIVDECSMVDEELGRDLLSFGVPVLVLGDPAQLPPVQGAGFFTEAKPDVMLEEVHRQAAGSPIIHLATEIRQGRGAQLGRYGESRVIPLSDLDAGDVVNADQVIVGTNKTRLSWNARIRELRGFNSDKPVRGEKLICLRNNAEKGVLNGMTFFVERVHKPVEFDKVRGWTRMAVAPDGVLPGGATVNIAVKNEFWCGKEGGLKADDLRGTDQFTFGHAITGHKSQGSQWNDVLIRDESGVFRDDARRWLYTAVTRAAAKVTVLQ